MAGPPCAAWLLLLDSRIELKESDRAVLDLLDQAAVTYQLVLTKADGTRPMALARKQAEAAALARQHAAAHPNVITTSSQTGLGMPELRARTRLAGLTAAARPRQRRPRRPIHDAAR